MREWPGYEKWSIDELLRKYGEVKFRAEAVDWPLKTYVDYMNNTLDESPLYLFDRSFVEKMDIKVGKETDGQYWVPECFGEDLFAVLGGRRPDSRWLIVGPERSGSTFHKDPNATRFVLCTSLRTMSTNLTATALGMPSFVAQNTGSCFPPPHPIRLHPASSFPRIRVKSPAP